MAKRKFRIVRIGGWIVAAIFSLVLLITVVFYVGREYFLKKAVTYLNEQQPGEVQMGQMNLIPFLNFPDVTLSLQDVKFYERELMEDTSGLEPILSLKEIDVTLDLIQLIKGGIMVSEARMRDGFVYMEIYPDSISNLEHALGIRFGAPAEKDTSVTESSLTIDLDKLELINVRARMDNRVTDEYMDIEVNQLESSFSYLSGQIRAALEVDIYINMVKYQTINDQIDKHVNLKGSILLDPDAQLLTVEPSSLNVSGLAFETWGSVELRTIPRIDLGFRATNEGLELLNYLFMGILDLEEIEQIGNGTIHLNGTVHGNMGGDQLPVIHVDGGAEELGFRIKTLNRDVTDISFRLAASNGSKSDLSEGFLEVQEFNARFPEGNIYANITASNIISPELIIEVDCAVDLEGLEEMFNKDFLSDLSGSLTIQGGLSGNVNRESGNFLNDEGSFTATLNDIAFVINHDSITRDSLRNISGEFVLHDTIIESEKLALDFNGNQFNMGFSTENLLLYLLGYSRDVTAGLSLSSEMFTPATLLKDTSITNMLGEEIEALSFSAETVIGKEDLDNFLEYDSIPHLEFSVDSFGVSLPFLAEISDVNASLSFGPDSLTLHQLEGTLGGSSFSVSGMLANFGVFSQADSGEVVTLDFNISSALMRAEDLFTINNEFLLPQTYSTEYLEDFKLMGRLDADAAGLIYDTVSMDFALDIEDLGWSFGNYPLAINNFLVQVRRVGDLLEIENLQGSVGENSLYMAASLENITDSLIENFSVSLLENISGDFELYSDLIDVNQILEYQQLYLTEDVQESDSTEKPESSRLDNVQFPQIDFTVNIGELRYGNHRVYGMNGKFRSSKEKILYLDKLVTSPEGKGSLEFNGQLNLTNPERYIIIAELDLKGIDIGDLNLEMQSGDSILLLNDHFHGIVDAKGLAEIFITPDLKVDIPSTTAAFNVRVTDGALINFTPLQAAGKYLDSKDLNHVRFATVRNSFTLTDSRIKIPLMNVESTMGQLLIEGEQGLDNSYLYIVRVPPKLAKQAARSAMSEGVKEDGEDQVMEMRRGDFLNITVWSNGVDSDFKLGDRRNKFQE